MRQPVKDSIQHGPLSFVPMTDDGFRRFEEVSRHTHVYARSRQRVLEQTGLFAAAPQDLVGRDILARSSLAFSRQEI